MKNNLPTKQDSNIFNRIWNSLKKFFIRFKKDEIQDTNMPMEENKESNKLNSDFSLQLKVDENFVNSEHEKEKFMQQLEEKPELLNSFSIERLEMILKYYQEENAKKEEILKKLTT